MLPLRFLIPGFFLLLHFIGFQSVFGQSRYLALEKITIADGLSQSVVNEIFQDRFGFLWFGTQDGLNRFDGYRFEVFKYEYGEAGSLSNSYVMKVGEDRRGNLWVGTFGGGLNRFNRSDKKFTAFQHRADDVGSLSGNKIISFVEDDSGTLWVGSYGTGLNKLELADGRITRLVEDPQAAGGAWHGTIWVLHIDGDGRLWAGGNQGLYLYHPQQDVFSLVPLAADGASQPRVRQILEDRSGLFWIAAWQDGLIRLDPHSLTHTLFRHDPFNDRSLTEGNVRAIAQDATGDIWVATYGGLNRLYGPEFQAERFYHQGSNPKTISTNQVNHVFVDRSNVLWLSMPGNGLDKLSLLTRSFTHFLRDPTQPDSLPSSIVFSFAAEDDKIWIGTYDAGLALLDEERQGFQHFPPRPDREDGLPHEQINTLLVDEAKRLWVGTYGGGLALRLKGDTFRVFRHDPADPDSIGGDEITWLSSAGPGKILIGLRLRGFDLFDVEAGRFQHFRHRQQSLSALNPDDVSYVVPSLMGGIWSATRGGGLLYWAEGGAVDHFVNQPENPDSLVNNTVNSVLELEAGKVWLATDGGLASLEWQPGERPLFRHFGTAAGLANNIVNGVVAGQPGTLWLSTNSGLSQFDIQRGVFLNFDASNGLQSNEFNQGAFFRAPSGELFFGGINGFNAFNPWEIAKNDYLPPIVLTDFRKFNKPAMLGQPLGELQELQLSYQDHMVSFSFAALDFNAPGRNSFAYKLEGFDDTWVELGNKHEATFTNLDDGDYLLRIRGSNNGGLWNEEGLSLSIRVIPPFWRTRWAILTYLLFGAMCIWLWHSWRVYLIKSQRQKLKMLVSQRTLELSSKNLQLEEQAFRLKQVQQDLLKAAHLAGMAEIAAGVLHNVGNTLNSMGTSAEIIHQVVASQRVIRLLDRIADILNNHRDLLAATFEHNAHLCQLPDTMQSLRDLCRNQNIRLCKEAEELKTHIHHVYEIVTAQQEHTQIEDFYETVDLAAIVQDVLKIQEDDFRRLAISCRLDLADRSFVRIKKSKFMHVVLNLVKNACDALVPRSEGRFIQLSLKRKASDGVALSVTDNGCGIPQENLEYIFNHGFTTKKDGHGFGLHFCANTIREMGGEIEVQSDGQGCGTTFTIKLKEAVVQDAPPA